MEAIDYIKKAYAETSALPGFNPDDYIWVIGVDVFNDLGTAIKGNDYTLFGIGFKTSVLEPNMIVLHRKGR